MSDALRRRIVQALTEWLEWERSHGHDALLRDVFDGHEIGSRLVRQGEPEAVAERAVRLCEECSSQLLRGQSPILALVTALHGEWTRLSDGGPVDYHKVTGRQQRLLRQALQGVFRESSNLEMFIVERDYDSLEHMVTSGSFDKQVFHLIEESIRIGCLNAFMQDVHEEHPGAPALDDLFRQLRPPDIGEEMDELLAQLEESADEARPRRTWNLSEHQRPYPGLRAFDREHAPIFFGREDELQDLVRLLTTEQGRRFAIVTGASGSGKSSLVRAGLWARLEKGEVPQFPGSGHWLITAMIPGELSSPAAALRAATTHGVRENPRLQTELPPDWVERLAAIEDDEEPLTIVADLLLAKRPEARWLILLDQMEELFAPASEEAGRRFLHRLIEAVKPTTDGGESRIQVLATIRADLAHHLLTEPELVRIGNSGGKLELGRPTRFALERMISGPLEEVELEKDGERVEWTLDPRLTMQLAMDASREKGGLALMAFALEELYDRCESTRQMDLATYQSKDFGELSGVIGRKADEVLEQLGEGAEEALGRVFQHLVSVSLDSESVARRRAPRDAWADDPDAERLVGALEKARLLVADAPKGREPVVEVAHEALLREWPKLAEWIEDNRKVLRLEQLVQVEANEWMGGDSSRQKQRPWPVDRIEDARRRLAEAGRLERACQNAAVARFLTPEVDWIQEELKRDETGHQRRRDIGQRLAEIGDPRPGVGLKDGVPEILWRPIPPGTVEIEKHGRFPVERFHMAAYAVTVEQFAAFVEAEDGFKKKKHWWKDLQRQEPEDAWRSPLTNHPVTEVSWYDATAFCRWLSGRLGYEVRLPDEAEWQWAAQSAQTEFAYPWGPDWKDGVANTSEAGINRTTAVGVYPAGASLQEVFDLAGNVWEWCRNEHQDPRKSESSDRPRALRGGSWDFRQGFARAAFRLGHFDPYARDGGLGFRVVCSAPIL